MDIERSTVTKIKLTSLEILDPITAYIEDLGESKGKITIECFGKSWSAFWGGMGGRDLTGFFNSCDVDYLSNCLWDHKREQYCLDYDQISKEVKERVLYSRRLGVLNKDDARELYGIDCWETYAPQHTYDSWSKPDFVSEDGFSDIELDEIELKETYTSEYKYLMRIVEQLKLAMTADLENIAA